MSSSDNYIYALVTNDLLESFWMLNGFYDPNLNYKLEFWESISRIGSVITGLWCVLGDFHAILEQKTFWGQNIHIRWCSSIPKIGG